MKIVRVGWDFCVIPRIKFIVEKGQPPFVVLEKLDVVVVVFIYRFKNLVKVFLLELCRTYRPPADYPEQIAIVDKLTVNPGFLVFEEVYLFFPRFESPGQDYVV